MKLKFKHQAFQAEAVQAVVDCFKGQPNMGGAIYRMDPGVEKVKDSGQTQTTMDEFAGFKNSDLMLTDQDILGNIKAVQRCQMLSEASQLVRTNISRVNLDIEMETGTGKTYCYIKTIFEMYQRFGWTKFIVVVPSIAIREGVFKSLEITAEHFLESYHRKARFFIYNSKQLHNLESFSSDAGINIMVINVQAFNARGKDNRRIYEELDAFRSRRPIDVIKANRPILILDEPQKMEGSKTIDSLKEFNPLFILRYSATHKKEHNLIYRLDALDAYQQKLVKKISVRGISVKGLAGTSAYLYLDSIEISKSCPVARIELEVKQKNSVEKVLRRLKKGDNILDQSNGLNQYKGFVIADINAITDTVEFTNGHRLNAGEATGDMNETALRRIQIREAIRAHFEKEQVLFHKGIKVLTLFFIDKVDKYRIYMEEIEERGEYAVFFEKEYENYLKALIADKALSKEYRAYLEGISVSQTHNGYFSIDKKSRRMIDPKMNTTEKKKDECKDVDAYDLILKDKERLLSFEEPTRFIFSHSALREGWDNPNVFVICMLKHSESTISRRQEVGRGLRLSVNQYGERQDDPATVHETNILTTVTNESYEAFVSGLQKDIRESLGKRPQKVDVAFLKGKYLPLPTESVEISSEMAEDIASYLKENGYTDKEKKLTTLYHEAAKEKKLAPLPENLTAYTEPLYRLLDSLYSDALLPEFENDRRKKTNPLNANFHKKEFKALWEKINHKAAYSVHFDSTELIKKCIAAINSQLKVAPLQYTVKRGDQAGEINYEQIKAGEGFEIRETRTQFNKNSVYSKVKYDLVGKVAESLQLTRRTVSEVLRQIDKPVFDQFKINPEHFISEVSRLIQEQKATMIVEHLRYNPISETHDIDIFTTAQQNQDFSKVGKRHKSHIYDYVIADSKVEKNFAENLDNSSEVVVYAKLPKGFFIPTPVGKYNPDWAIAFNKKRIKHIYFVAETKGSLSTMELRKIETTKIECARKFFDEINHTTKPEHVKYGVVKNYEQLMQLVGGGLSEAKA